jgi:hypothetical protein
MHVEGHSRQQALQHFRFTARSVKAVLHALAGSGGCGEVRNLMALLPITHKDLSPQYPVAQQCAWLQKHMVYIV